MIFFYWWRIKLYKTTLVSHHSRQLQGVCRRWVRAARPCSARHWRPTIITNDYTGILTGFYQVSGRTLIVATNQHPNHIWATTTTMWWHPMACIVSPNPTICTRAMSQTHCWACIGAFPTQRWRVCNTSHAGTAFPLTTSGAPGRGWRKGPAKMAKMTQGSKGASRSTKVHSSNGCWIWTYPQLRIWSTFEPNLYWGFFKAKVKVCIIFQGIISLGPPWWGARQNLTKMARLTQGSMDASHWTEACSHAIAGFEHISSRRYGQFM